MPLEFPVTRDEFGRGSNLLGFSADSRRLLFTETRGTRNVLLMMTLNGESSLVGHPKTGTGRSLRSTRPSAEGCRNPAVPPAIPIFVHFGGAGERS